MNGFGWHRESSRMKLYGNYYNYRARHRLISANKKTEISANVFEVLRKGIKRLTIFKQPFCLEIWKCHFYAVKSSWGFNRIYRASDTELFLWHCIWKCTPKTEIICYCLLVDNENCAVLWRALTTLTNRHSDHSFKQFLEHISSRYKDLCI